MPNFLEDEEFLDSLLAYTCSDRKFLRRNSTLLKADDFKPQAGAKGGRDRWVIATKALEHWLKFREPVADVLQAELAQHAKLSKLNPRRTKELRDYAAGILEHPKLSPTSVAEKLKSWKLEVVLSDTISKLIDEQGGGALTPSRFLELAREAVQLDASLSPQEEEFLDPKEIEERIERRRRRGDTRFIPLLIDPFDAEIRGIARGHIGLILAPYKRGKSLMLIHIAIAYVVQRLKVLYITLEDPKDDVEDRFDAAISTIPMRDLNRKPNRLMKNYKRFSKVAKGRIRIIDRVEEGVSIADVEELWLREKENGFEADAVIVDYDDEIQPPRKRTERRHEFADIYRDFRRFAARNNILGWTACQTQRGTKDVVQLGGDSIAEDISKVRKVALAIGIGKAEPEWENEVESCHLWIAAHKFDKQNLGFNIASNKASALIYDRAKTFYMMKKQISQRAANV